MFYEMNKDHSKEGTFVISAPVKPYEGHLELLKNQKLMKPSQRLKEAKEILAGYARADKEKAELNLCAKQSLVLPRKHKNGITGELAWKRCFFFIKALMVH
jgi:hypothetical protein